jgi:uncharacterized membrane protein YjgN (DUF898 family)
MTFNVIFEGVLPGVEREEAKQSFGKLFGLDAEKVALIFASGRRVIKRNLTHELAHKLVAKLASIGVQASVMEPETPLTPEPAASHLEHPQVANPAHGDLPQPAMTLSEPQVKHFVFSGAGFEYFKIWIVNIFLTIATLGIYSAWAKVRNERYFYGNTSLDGSHFEYTAKPMQILVGRIIAFAAYLVFIALSQYSPIAALGLMLLFFLIFPFIVVSSLRFNARNSLYRNISFQFQGGYKEALIAFLVWPILTVLTLTALLPLCWKRQMEFIINNHAYGTERFQFEAKTSDFYMIYLMLIGVSLAFFTALSGVMFLVGGFSVLTDVAAGGAAAAMAVMLIIPIYLGFIVLVGSYMTVSLANLQYNHTQLGEHGFQADWKLLSFAKMFSVNTLMTLLTMGLYIPFAKVRMAAYMADHTRFVAVGELDQFKAGENQPVSTVAEGLSDIFQVNVGV